MLNQQQIINKWNEMKGGIRNVWGKITEKELDEIQGDMNKLVEKVKEKYLETDQDINHDITNILSSFENESDLADHDTNESSYQRRPTDN